MVNKTISIQYLGLIGKSNAHEIVIENDYGNGFCKTHSKHVTKYDKCPVFTFNNAMWTDLWGEEVAHIND